MRSRIRGGLLVSTTIVCAVLGACTNLAPVEEDGASASRQAPTLDGYRYALARAFQQISGGELAEAYPELTSVIHAPAFDQLGSPERHAALLMTGLVAIDLDKFAEGHAFLVRSSAMQEATEDDWLARLTAAHRLDKREDAVHSLTQLVRRWPEMAQELNYRAVLETVSHARHVPESESVLHALLDSLYVANWKLPYGLEPDSMWRDLAAIELDRHQFARAQEIASRVQSPHIVVSMRIDRRFDRLREAVPQYFDVDAAVANQLERMRALVQQLPRSLDAVVQLTYSMLTAGLYNDVLETTTEVLRVVDDASAEQPPYDDMDKLIWILDNRSRALAATQRWSEAEAQVRAAANRKENGHRNVSNVINLVWFYAEAGRSDEALAALSGLGQDMSPYGLMQMHGARHAAALQKGDIEIANESFAYLEQHRNDALDTWQWALVRANRLDEAAALLIERLRDPVLRSRALLDLQDYAETTSQSQGAVWKARWKEIKNRPDVRRAIDAVGRIESFRITGVIG